MPVGHRRGLTGACNGVTGVNRPIHRLQGGAIAGSLDPNARCTASATTTLPIASTRAKRGKKVKCIGTGTAIAGAPWRRGPAGVEPHCNVQGVSDCLINQELLWAASRRFAPLKFQLPTASWSAAVPSTGSGKVRRRARSFRLEGHRWWPLGGGSPVPQAVSTVLFLTGGHRVLSLMHWLHPGKGYCGRSGLELRHTPCSALCRYSLGRVHHVGGIVTGRRYKHDKTVLPRCTCLYLRAPGSRLGTRLPFAEAISGSATLLKRRGRLPSLLELGRGRDPPCGWPRRVTGGTVYTQAVMSGKKRPSE